MKRAFLKSLPALIVGSCFVPSAIALQTIIPSPLTIAQAASTYDAYMQSGYSATAKRDYEGALVNFRKALGLRPNNKYALQAISNVSKYAEALRGEIVTYIPRNTGAPIAGGTGATRGCSTEGIPIALLPKGETLTTENLPVLLVYMPRNPGTKVEFVLQERDGDNIHEIYETNITPTKSAGVISLDLATFPGLPVLQDGKEYQWYVSLICNEADRSADVAVTGLVKKIALDPLLVKELQAAKPSDRAVLYAVNGIWYDALATLYKARQSSPNDPLLNQSWASLIKAVELGRDENLVQQYKTLPNEPLVECCTVSSSKEGLTSAISPQR